MNIFSQMMKNQKEYWITITFGECCENRVGNQMIGTKASVGEGFSIQNLLDAKSSFEKMGVKCQLIDLTCKQTNVVQTKEKAMLLVIRGGINALLEGSNYTYMQLEKELKNCKWDKKALGLDGNVINLNARHNLCFADTNQEPNYEKGEGTIMAFSDLPILQHVRNALPFFIGEKAEHLLAEGNYYFDKHKCAISYHGDIERRKVIGLRFGATMPICYQWFVNGSPVGDTIKVDIEEGDMYIMSENAVGTDNTFALALKHAAGFDKNISVKLTKMDKVTKLESVKQQSINFGSHSVSVDNKHIYDLLYNKFPELHRVLNDVGVLDINLLMKNPYPSLIGVIIGQKISFKRAKELRKKLYTVLGTSDFTLDQFISLQQNFTSFETFPIIERVNKFLKTKNDDFLYSEDNIKSLIQIEGIGPWTIESTLLCCFKKLHTNNNTNINTNIECDVFPSGDKFLQNALLELNLTNEKMSAARAKKISEKWSPYRGYVTWYLWRWFPEIRTK